MKITTLIENRESITEPGLSSEWGLSLCIEVNNHSILFDTGASGAFVDNAKHLSIQVDSFDAAVLSHHHFDHGGGLKRFFELNSSAKVFLADAPDGECFIKIMGFLKKYIGLDRDIMDHHRQRFEFVGGPTEILPDVFIFPQIVDTYPKPLGNKHLYLKTEGRLSPDEFSHEIVMAIKENEKLVIFTGCSHNGILNMIDTVAREFEGVPIKAVVGGFHLVASPPFHFMAGTRKDIEKLGKSVLDYPVEVTFTGHCTGKKAFSILKSVMGDRLQDLRTGSRFDI
ncbi:MBL fold metallo-hydrolase [Desulforhopalus singaporensis]|uniref:7,8-dihydropterin-6-yl-methyl-4-(Beta-D-ribofuranosyl)aminobenzene 5'-phosphate synthase n=1 Tax=Desulforhopalus singaporensis TaxID=91360 RepID=A0A1H0KLZ1_9BACT|nr:MBL fold metallo-hydrolase [Desulforhopalus singaporensis]SDO56895.1 7,8-dihydropterin-6-yl-methyl-4-(beta-D-ribofuranosyl)aminobenzene 5'-phosphate synthase [Desulforhopalus singaporensis]